MFEIGYQVFARSAGGDPLADSGQQTSSGAWRRSQTVWKRVRETVERCQVIVEGRHHLGGEAESVEAVIGCIVRNVKHSVPAANHHPLGRTIRKSQTRRPQQRRHVEVTAWSPVFVQEAKAALNVQRGELRNPVGGVVRLSARGQRTRGGEVEPGIAPVETVRRGALVLRSEEHTSELQSQSNLVCRLLLERKKRRRCGRARPGHAELPA